MNIGILTFHYAHNYGAVLQAYALKKVLETNGHKVEIINYHNPWIERNYPYDRSSKKVTIGIGFKESLNTLAHNYEVLKGDHSWKHQYDKFERWIKKNLDVHSEILHKLSDLEQLKKDVFICGSDQIWNPNLTKGFDPIYFLRFNTDALKLSYAASIGLEAFEKRLENQFFKYLEAFNHISVREDTLKKYISTNKAIDVDIVQDPVFLLNQNDYYKLAIKPKISKYLLVYSLKEDQMMLKYAQAIAKRKGLQCIELKYFHNPFQHDVKQIAYAGPSEFLGLIAYADCVVSNSFHGTAFSIIFNKEFYCISVGAVNSRISDLLNRFDLMNRMISNDEISEVKINYKELNERLSSERKRSKELLFKMITK